MAAKIFRINYKSDFILTMNSEAGWTIPFCIKFWTSIPMRAYYVGFDGTTYTHCAYDPAEPTKLLVQFDDHHLPIGNLHFQIAYHFTVEDFPNNTEDEVFNATAITTEIDGETYQVMLDFTGETAPEIEFNLPAYANEAQRIANEEQRISNEAQRIANEEQRIANEEQRISNEEQRISAESIRIANEESRISEFAQLKHDAEIATADANAAATLANEKAALAAEKAALSQAAAELANAKATLAQQKADYAQAQGDYAKAQGDYAKDQGNIAEADHERAESDHTRAENDHTAVEVYVDSLGAFDISAYHATGGVLAKYVDLSAALDGGDNIPEAIRKGGMSVKFVQSSDNKYVQYFLTKDDWSASEADWEKMNLEEELTELGGELALGAVYDVSAHNNNATFTSLSALLSDANLSTLIPVDVRKGGMSVKFVQSSDNKYVQYRLMADEFSTNTDDWAFYDNDVYTESPEFVKVVTDAEGRILYGITIDGEFIFGVGVPQSIKDYVLSQKADVDADVLAEKTRAIAAEQALSTTKVNKEEGKGLIPTQYINEIENPEFIKVITDNEDKILYGIKVDGSFYFGLGVPQQVIDYVTEHQNATREELLALIDTKVDKEEDKSLIDADYASSQSAIDNPEFLEVTTDSEDKVLEGIQQDGTKVIGGDLRVLGNMEVSEVSYKVIENPEYLAAWVDAENKVIFGLKVDGKTYVGDADFLNDIKNNQEAIAEIKTTLAIIGVKVDSLDIDALSSITATENPEYIETIIDSEGKLLAGRTPDGAAFENVGFSTPKVTIDGHITKNIKDPEGRIEIKTDAEGKILSYRDTDGVKHENVGIKTGSATIDEVLINNGNATLDSATINSLNLTSEGMTEFQQALKDSGFQPGGAGNFSDATELHIPEPYCVRVNFTGIDSMPQTKTTDAHAYMEFYDMAGNYFKKEVIMNAQGRSTMSHPKKNIAIDICNNNGWDDDDTFSLQIGDWVPQDSFHLKAFYNDPFRGLSAVAYKLYDEVLKSRGEFDDYVWKRALLDFSNVTPTSTGCADAEEAIEGWNTNARCFPMGFPCIVYLNGDFYGIYSWQLKKHRDNYMMSKKKTKHIHLDGLVNTTTILNADGDSSKIIWTTDTPEGIEIRNPKPKKKKDGWEMTMMDGTKYDADANGGELIDSTSANWDATNESHVKSAEVKQYILNLSKVIPTLADDYSTYQASSKTDEDKAAFKEVFETYFDVDNLIDYLIFSDVLANYDGFSQNVQWITYNGKKWYLCAYDLDGVMGNWWQLNDTIVAPVNAHYSAAQFQYIPIFYNTELETRYKELRDMGIISVSNIINLVEDWLKRIGGKETFEKEWEKWPSFIKNDNVHRLYKWLQISISNMDTLYNYNQN